MKHFAISCLALLAWLAPNASSAQCDADFDFNGATFAVNPNAFIGESFVDGQVGMAYEDILHVILPNNTADIPGAPLSVPLDSLVLNELFLVGEMGEPVAVEDIGLSFTPNNNGDSGNPNTFLGGNQYCAAITGVPDTAGFFTAAVNTTAWVTVPFIGANAIDFPFEGFSLLIEAAAVTGCTDEAACNYNPDATADDGSCEYTSCAGCTDAMACNYAMDATIDDGSCTYAMPGMNCDGSCINDADMDGVCDELEGCTDMTACNFDPAATDDDGSCTFAADYYDCAGACLNDADGDGVCDELEVVGCSDDTACNYNELATDEGDCEYAEAFYDCDGNCLVDSDGDGVCDELEVVGCTDATACNYNELATDEGDCEYAAEFYDCDGMCVNDADGDGVCDELEVLGCDNPDACNYDDMATEDDGTCVLVGDACDDGYSDTINDIIDEYCECGGDPIRVEEVALASLEVFPNPASATVFLGLGDATLLQGAEVTVRNLAGAEVQRVVLNGRSTLDVSSLTEGLYLLTVTSNHGVATRRFTVAR